MNKLFHVIGLFLGLEATSQTFSVAGKIIDYAVGTEMGFAQLVVYREDVIITAAIADLG